MMRGIGLVIAIAALILFSAVSGRANDATYDITVTADATKANGSPWDGIPGLRNSKANLNAAPDIAVCVVKANARPDCLWRPQGRRLLSRCQNAWTCRFPNMSLAPLPIGLVLIDIDARNHDVIDVVVLTSREDATSNDAIGEALRTAMSVLTPNASEDTKERRVRNAKVIPLQDCAGSKPCRLGQSEIVLESSK